MQAVIFLHGQVFGYINPCTGARTGGTAPADARRRSRFGAIVSLVNYAKRASTGHLSFPMCILTFCIAITIFINIINIKITITIIAMIIIIIMHVPVHARTQFSTRSLGRHEPRATRSRTLRSAFSLIIKFVVNYNDCYQY